MSFQAFATGFFDTSSQIIGRRKDQAENYFEQQMERARTHGMNNLQQRRHRRDQMEGAALQLRQNAQMPEEIVRALINEGPEALTAALRIYEDSANNGVELSEEFWRDTAYPTVRDMSIDTDTPLADFLNQVAGLYSNNLEATLETGGDPFSAFVSSALGLNAMDRARSRLQETEIAAGFSAGDLLALESRPQHERAFETAGFGPNLQNISAARAAVGTPLTPAQIRTYNSNFNSGLNEEARRYQFEQRALDINVTIEEAREAVRTPLAERFAADSGLTDSQLSQLPSIWRHLPESVREVLEPSGESGEQPDESQQQVDFPQTIRDVDGNEGTLVEVLSNGTAVYQTPDGILARPITIDQARMAQSSQTVSPTPGGPTTELPSPMARAATPAARSAQEERPRVTYEEWQGMSRQERRAADLPVSELGAQRYFQRFAEGMRVDSQNPFGVGDGGMLGPNPARSVSTDPVEGSPPSQIRMGGEVLTISRYDPATDSWVYVNQDTGRETFIPVGERVEPN